MGKKIGEGTLTAVTGVNSRPKVTIMIPTFRQEDTILDAVDSALSQDYPHLEVIVADDASPDRTAQLVATRRDPRLHYHRNRANLGRVANYRHTLYDLATGEWAVNLDGDDYYIDPGFISAAVETALADPEIVIVSSRISSGSAPSPAPAESLVPGRDMVLRLHESSYRFMHLATLYNRPKAMASDFYRMDVVSSDWESLYRLALLGRVAFLDRVAAVWRIREGSASRSADWRALADNLGIWPSIYGGLTDGGFPAERIRLAQRSIMFSAAYNDLSSILAKGNTLAAMRYILRTERFDARLTMMLLTNVKLIAKLLLSLDPFRAPSRRG